MSRSAMIRARMEPSLKKEAESVLHKLGLSVTEAIHIFYRQVKLRRGLPFAVALPNETTLKTFKDTDAGKNIVECKDCEDMFDQLGISC